MHMVDHEGVEWFVRDAWRVVAWTDDPDGEHALATVEHHETGERLNLSLTAEPDEAA